jgi:hypothetical protein
LEAPLLARKENSAFAPLILQNMQDMRLLDSLRSFQNKRFMLLIFVA